MRLQPFRMHEDSKAWEDPMQRNVRHRMLYGWQMVWMQELYLPGALSTWMRKPLYWNGGQLSGKIRGMPRWVTMTLRDKMSQRSCKNGSHNRPKRKAVRENI